MVTLSNLLQQIITALQTAETENENFILVMKAVLPWRFVRLIYHVRARSRFSTKRRNSKGTKSQESAVRYNLIRGPIPCKAQVGRGAGRMQTPSHLSKVARTPPQQVFYHISYSDKAPFYM
jgi:predicted type IV restriction endonuclease